jgi:CHAT domain-containing protein
LRRLAEGLRLPELLAGLPADTRGLAVVPDDSLHGFPFAACRHRGRYLVEHYALSTAFERTAGPPPRPAGPPGPALTVAVTRVAPPTDSFPFSGAELPGTRPEVERVGAWLAGRGLEVCCLVDDDAGREAVLDQWRRASYVHAACHGIFRPDRPDATGLVLVPRPGRPEVLSLADLARLETPGLRHVTLSNCWLADAFVLPGRWVVTLPETLCRAGARSVLASLWPLADDVAIAFSERFYHHLSALPRDEALRATQLECLGGTLPGVGRQALHPFSWAGYQLHGEPGPLPVPPG